MIFKSISLLFLFLIFSSPLTCSLSPKNFEEKRTFLSLSGNGAFQPYSLPPQEEKKRAIETLVKLAMGTYNNPK